MFYRQFLILFLSKLTELCGAKYEVRHTAVLYTDTNGSDLSLQFGHGEKNLLSGLLLLLTLLLT